MGKAHYHHALMRAVEQINGNDLSYTNWMKSTSGNYNMPGKTIANQ